MHLQCSLEFRDLFCFHNQPCYCVTNVTQKKRFIETLAVQGTVSHAAQAAGISRNTAYRWRFEDREFRSGWDEALDMAVDEVESTLYQKAKSGDTVAMIFYLKAHRPIYRDRLNIDVRKLQNQIEDGLDVLRERAALNGQPSERAALIASVFAN